MIVKINDTEITLADGMTLTDALASQSISTQGTALAVNGTVIPKANYDSTTLNHGDSILIIKAFYGG